MLAHPSSNDESCGAPCRGATTEIGYLGASASEPMNLGVRLVEAVMRVTARLTGVATETEFACQAAKGRARGQLRGGIE